MQTIKKTIAEYGEPIFRAISGGCEIVVCKELTGVYIDAYSGDIPYAATFMIEMLIRRLAEVEAYSEDKDKRIESLQKKLAGLRPSDTLNIHDGDGQAQLDALEEMRGRVPLMEGWYGAYDEQLVAWVATDEDADKLFRQENIDEVGHISMLRHKGYDLSPFIPLREAYYAAQ